MKKVLISFSILLFLCTLSFAAGESSGDGGSDGITIGVTLETFDDVFMQGVKDEVEKTAASLGAKVIIVDAKSNPAEQVKQVENFITSGLSAIIVHVINNDIANTITSKAVAAGVPLVYMNRGAPASALPSGEKVAVVASPEVEAGKGQAKFVAETLAAKGVTSGNVVILLGGLGSAPQIGRTQGVKDYIAENGLAYEVIREQTANWKRPDAVAVIENWLASGDDFVAVFANNDEMALGASLALTEAGMRDKVLIVGVDANADALVAIEEGRMDMSMFQNGRAQGSGSVEAAVKMASGEAFEQVVDIPFEAVSKENVGQYK